VASIARDWRDDADGSICYLNTPARSGGPDNLNHRTLRLLLTAFVRHADTSRCFTTEYICLRREGPLLSALCCCCVASVTTEGLKKTMRRLMPASA
jgi:hypothetical protein